MSPNDLHGTVAITGASGYTGKYLARRLLTNGVRVINLTGHPNRPVQFTPEEGLPGSPNGPQDLPGEMVGRRYRFDDPAAMTAALKGAHTLFNTYWVRFEHDGLTFRDAIQNSYELISAAKAAGVRRIVHVSIANPALESSLPYFRGKAEVEAAIRESGLSYAILRPTVLFGLEDILINNIVFLLRRFPVFAVPGSGEYRLQPVYVGDMADLMIAAARSEEDTVMDAVGPEVYTFNALIDLLKEKTGARSWTIHLPPGLALSLSRVVGWLVKDVVLTEHEVRGLMDERLISIGPPTAPTRFSRWLDRHADQLGRRYSSELQRHYREPHPGEERP